MLHITLLCRPGQSQGCSTNTVVIYTVILLSKSRSLSPGFTRQQAKMVWDGASSHIIDYVAFFYDIKIASLVCAQPAKQAWFNTDMFVQQVFGGMLYDMIWTKMLYSLSIW